MVTRLGVSAELIPANSRTTVTARSEMCRYTFPPQNLPENRTAYRRSPRLAAGCFENRVIRDLWQGISILSSLAVGILHPARLIISIRGALAITPGWSRDSAVTTKTSREPLYF